METSTRLSVTSTCADRRKEQRASRNGAIDTAAMLSHLETCSGMLVGTDTVPVAAWVRDYP